MHNLIYCRWCLSLTVQISREDGIEPRVIIWDLVHVLYLVEVVGELPGDGAVEPGLQVGRPILVEDVLAACVALADACNARVDTLAAVHVLDGNLTEEEVDILADLVGADKVRLVKVVRVVLDRALEAVFTSA